MMVARSSPVQRLDTPVKELIRAEVTRIFIDQTVGQALAQVQREGAKGRIVYFYVVDASGRLCGVLPARSLLLNPPETRVADVMAGRLVKLPDTATLGDACDLFMLHRLLALPIVDQEDRLLGVVDVEVYTDEVFDLADREISDDVFQLIGVRLAEVERASVPMAFFRRFPWLLASIASGLACAVVAGAFQGLLARAVVVAMFIPVVLALGESVSIQSLTLTLQAQHGTRVRWPAVFRALRRELPISLLLGLACGTLVGLVAWAWDPSGRLTLAMIVSIVLAVMTAAMFGLLVPVVLWAIQRDPKVASGPVALALSDIATLLYFFGVAAYAIR